MKKWFKSRGFCVSLSFISFILIGLVVLLITIIAMKPKEEVNAASEYTITIDKTSTVTIYISGQDVTLKESKSNGNVYLVKQGTEITIRAVNELKIFQNWIITDENNNEHSYNNSTEQKLSFIPTSNLKISVNRVNPTPLDYGKYMYNHFLIRNSQDLLDLEAIIAYGPFDTSNFDADIIKRYNHFFNSFDAYSILTTDESRYQFIIDHNLYERLQYGYYSVSNNLSLYGHLFTGIGTAEYPFQGVVCGLSSYEISNVFIMSSTIEKAGTNYYGLFGYLGEKAIVRNLKVTTSIGIDINSSNTSKTTIYAGGVAGYLNDALLTNVTVSTNMGINVNNATIYAGGIAGYIEKGGIDCVNKVEYKGINDNWIINSNAKANTYAGIVSGYGNSVYVNTFNVDTTGLSINATNNRIDSYSTNINNYIGGLFGYLDVNKDIKIANIKFYGQSKHAFTNNINVGNAYLGGLIGYIQAKNNLNIGRISIENTDNAESIINSTSLHAISQANLYTGGLFGYVNGNNLIADDSFKKGITTKTVDGKTIYDYNYLFTGNFNISSYQNGEAASSRIYGKTIAGGIVAKGLFNMNGSSESNRSEIFISSPNSNFKVNATQSQIASHTNANSQSDKEHCISGIVFGIISVESFNYNFNNINLYANNANITSKREIGSMAMGDIIAGGFIGYSKSVNYNNITLYLNAGSIRVDSISFEIGNSLADTNNAFCGGFIGDFQGPNASMNNVEINGYDLTKREEIGTTTKISSIQNTKAPLGDYKGENYVGGLIGRIYLVSSISNVSYIGSTTDQDSIIMQGNEDPDSAFCGGLIGFIRNYNSNISSIAIDNCQVKNASINGYATNNDTSYNNPDIYVGGLIGASYNDNSPVSVYITNSNVYNSSIRCLGNERMEAYAAGIIGAMTWVSSSHIIGNCYVYGSIIEAISISSNQYAQKDQAYAAGICSHINGSNTIVNVSDTVVIDSVVDANSQNNLARSTGIAYLFSGILSVYNCYSNSYIQSTGKAQEAYPICNNGQVRNVYYVKRDDLFFTSLQGIALDFSNKVVNTNNVNIFKDTNGKNIDDSFRIGMKYWPILQSGKSFKVNNAGTNNLVTISYIGQQDQKKTDTVNMWINVKQSGSNINPTSYTSVEEAHNDGWFNLGDIIVYNQVDNPTNNDNIIDGIIDTTYIDGTNTYTYSKKIGDKTYLKNNSYPFNEIQSGYEEIETDSIHINNVNVIKNYIIKVYDGIPSMQIKFRTPSKTSIYKEVFWDQDGKETIVTNDSSLGIGTYNMSYMEESDYIEYTIDYIPNSLISKDTTFYLVFNMGTSEKYDRYCLKFDLISNKKQLNGVIFSPYSPPLNYYLQGIDDTLGSNTNPYLVRANAITKFLPIITKLNDLVETKYSDTIYTEYVTYELGKNGGGEIRSSGELIVGNSSNILYSIIVTLKEDPTQTKTIYFKIVDQYDVSYSVIGSKLNCLTYAASNIDYFAEIELFSNYGSKPIKFNITIGSNTYYLVQQENNLNSGLLYNSQIKVYKENDEEQLTDWIEDVKTYRIYIPNDIIDGNIQIEIEFPVVYTITLDLQSSSFNFNPQISQTLTFKLEAGTKFNEYFTQNIRDQISNWLDEAAVFGYVFTGFYMVYNANTEQSYGENFLNIMNSDRPIASSSTFYARWSFLIELVEAPGTKIRTVFSDSFMQDYYEESLVNRTIQIPINNNKGYAFTIVKDDNFLGTAHIEAYTISKIDGKEKITKVDIEKNYISENMYVYYIKPEKITGYLVIATSVSNSEIIVGENTATLAEEILPEDGIYTFKYMVNHTNTVDKQSYIYNSGNSSNINSNLSLNKDFALMFKQQSFDGTNTTIIDRSLDVGTIIEVYYKKFVNGHEEKQIVGTYHVKQDNTKEVLLSDFTLLNLGTEKAFPTEDFRTFLGNNEYVSEMYYFVITPPNGINHNVQNEIVNYIIYAGYVDNNRTSGFVEGIRNTDGFVNIPIEGILNDNINYESSMQSKIYSVTPSRNTSLQEEKDGTYTFIDNDKYHLFDVETKNCKLKDGILILFDDNINNSIITSKKIKFGIHKLNLSLGYDQGTVEIYGSFDGINWDFISEIYVNNPEYQTYEILFHQTYNYFKIDNTSTREIHLKSIDVVSASNGMVYSLDNLHSEAIANDNGIVTYSIINNIEGDNRHQGKSFMLAVQLKENNNISENIGDIKLKFVVNGKNYIVDAMDNGIVGRNVAYFNLSEILQEYDISELNFEIVIPDNMVLYAVQLLEVLSIYKPAMSEVRDTIIYNN